MLFFQDTMRAVSVLTGHGYTPEPSDLEKLIDIDSKIHIFLPVEEYHSIQSSYTNMSQVCIQQHYLCQEQWVYSTLGASKFSTKHSELQVHKPVYFIIYFDYLDSYFCDFYYCVYSLNPCFIFNTFRNRAVLWCVHACLGFVRVHAKLINCECDSAWLSDLLLFDAGMDWQPASDVRCVSPNCVIHECSFSTAYCFGCLFLILAVALPLSQALLF